jgi:hypothetical protein
MTTDTPRTDEIFYSMLCEADLVDFAKQLERDLISSVKLLAQLNTLRMTEDKSLSEDQWLEYCRLYRDYSK